MISIAICDDNIIDCFSISDKVHALLLKTGEEHTIKKFFDGFELLKSAVSFDIIFLDIKMKTDGLKTADLLRKRKKQFILIFVTAYQEYVYEAFEVEAFHYIQKPIDDVKLEKSIYRAIEKISNCQEHFIVINKNRETMKIILDDIIFFEIRGRIIIVHCRSNIIEYYEQISTLEQKINEYGFFRCHKSFLINLKYVEKFSKNEIIMDSGDKILLSKRRYEDFTKTFLFHMKKEGGIL